MKGRACPDCDDWCNPPMNECDCECHWLSIEDPDEEKGFEDDDELDDDEFELEDNEEEKEDEFL